MRMLLILAPARVQGSDEETRKFVQVCAYAHTPQTKNIQGAFPPSVPLLTATAVRLEPAPALHMPTNRSFGLRSWCSSATIGCLVQQGSYGYVAAPPALRTTGALRGVRIDLLIGNNTLPTWAGASRALARLALSHLVTYPLKINLRSSQLASPQVPSLNRLLA